MADWQNIRLQAGNGQQADIDPGAGSQALDRLENFVFTKEGALDPRPTYTRDTLSFQVRGTGAGYAGTTENSTLAGVLAGAPVRSLFTTVGRMGEKPAILKDGHLWIRDTAHWTDHLSAWSTQVTRGPDFSTIPVLTTTSLSATAWDANLGAITQLLDSTGRKVETSVGVTNVAGNVPGMARCGTTTGFFWIEGNNLRCALRTSGASTLATATLRTDAAAVGTVPQGVWACSSAGASVFYVAYATTTLGHVTLLRVSTAAAVLTAVDHNFDFTGDQIRSLSIDNTSALLVLGITYFTATNVRTSIHSAATLTNSGLNLAIAKTGSGDAAGMVVGCDSQASPTAYLAWYDVTTGTLDVATRFMLAATGAVRRTYFGSASAAGVPQVFFRTKHQPVLYNGRMVLGLSVGPDSNEHTWYDIDVTDVAGQDALGPRTTFVARGPIRGSYEPAFPVAAIVSTDAGTEGWRFGSWEYNSFDATGGATASDTMITVRPVQPAVVEINGDTVIGGSVPITASRWASEYGFPYLGAPELAGTVQAGGALTVGSYTAQATWVYTDPNGMVHRSAPSLPVTLTTTGGNQTLRFRTLSCQLTGKTEFLSPLRCELWITQVNPTATALKYLKTTATNSTAAATVLFSDVTTDPSTSAESLYTGAGEIIANWPPQGQAGMAVLGRRVWAADQFKVRATKLQDLSHPGALAWDAEDVLSVDPPDSAGSIRALASMDDKLAIFCERGIFFTGDDGPDNSGQGQDFVTPFHVSDLGVSHARSVVSTPYGVFFIADDTTGHPGVYLLGRDLQVKDIGRPIRDDLGTSVALDNQASIAYDNEQQLLLVTSPTHASVLFIHDVAVGRWTLWTHDVGGITERQTQFVAPVNGVIWKTSTAGLVGRFDDGTPPTDIGSSPALYTQLWRTGHIPIAGDGQAWGQLRSVNVLGFPSAVAIAGNDGTQITVTAVYDRERATTWSTSQNHDASDNPTTWPINRMDLEFRAPTQKCAEAQITVQANPGYLRLNAVELQVRSGDTRTPKSTTRT